MNITFLLYEEMTALDLVGAYEVLAGIPGARVQLAASEAGPQRTESGMRISADVAFADAVQPEIVVVPGTSKVQAALANAAAIAWLREVSPKAKWTASVCTGALLLGAAGLLRGRKATTHWLAHGMLQTFGAEPVRERVVFDGNLVTSAGVSAGIDMALQLAARVAGVEVAKVIQLVMEYDPKPPFDAGTPEAAGPEIVAAAMRAVAVDPQMLAKLGA